MQGVPLNEPKKAVIKIESRRIVMSLMEVLADLAGVLLQMLRAVG